MGLLLNIPHLCADCITLLLAQGLSRCTLKVEFLCGVKRSWEVQFGAGQGGGGLGSYTLGPCIFHLKMETQYQLEKF